MDKKVNTKIIFHKNKKYLLTQKNTNKKHIISKFHKYTVNSYKTNNTVNKNKKSKNISEINSKELYISLKNSNAIQTKNKSNLRKSNNKKSKTHNHKKIFIKIRQKKGISLDVRENISHNDTTLDKPPNTHKNKTNKQIIDEENVPLKNKNKKSNTFKWIEINVNEISNMKSLNRTYNNKTFATKNTDNQKIKNTDYDINNSDIINRSLGDSSLEINKPRKSENPNFSNFLARKSNITHNYTNNYFMKLYNGKYIEQNTSLKKIDKEQNFLNCNTSENNINYMRNRIINKKDNNYKQSFLFLCHKNNNDVENELDKFFNSNKNNKNLNNNELFRLSNISFYNNNDLFYVNTKNKNSIIEENKFQNRNNYFINPKIDNIELEENINLNEFLNDSFEEKISNQKMSKKNDNIISIPCTNCEKMINVSEIDEHSNKCYKITEEIKYNYSINNYISIIDNKIKNIYSHISNIQNDKKYIENNDLVFNEFLDLISKLKKNIEEILNTKQVNSLSLNKLSKINNNFDELIEKHYNSTSIYTLLSRIKLLLEEKIKYFIKHKENNLYIRNKLIKKGQKIYNKYKKNSNDNSFINENKDLYLNHDNSIDEVISESETMELFDLKKMKKLLDKKNEIKSTNLDNFVNEAKNKRLFMMEILKVKYQKINNDKSEDLIPSDMLWEEAKKQKIKINEWPKFIFDELSNSNKYLKMMQKIIENKEK